jgi:outer membrane protein assembly factor BamA
LEKNISNKNISSTRYSLPFLLIILVLSSCNPTKYVPQGETLLDETHITINKEGIKKSELEPYIKQKPNKRIFGAKFYLGLYNLSNIDKDRWPHKWLREIGEEPVIFDPVATEKTKEQIQSFITSKGFFDSHVMETVETANRKSKVFYNIDLKKPYTIRKLIFEMADTTIRKYFYFDSVNCLIMRGKSYDESVLQAEKTRFERYVRDRGFYSFSGDYVYFRVDSTIDNRKVDIYYGVKKFLKVDPSGKESLVPHSIYFVRDIYIYPDFIPKEALAGGEDYFKSFDTTIYNGYYFISRQKKSDIKYDLILETLYLKPGSLYNVTNTEQTQSHLLGLKTYRLVNISYSEIPEQDDKFESPLTLDCTIQLTPLNQQSFKVEFEGTNSEGFIGGAVNLIYQHKNLFHGAELFNLKLNGSYEALSQNDTLRSIQEYGIETSLRFPKFILPFLAKESFIKKYNPTTTLIAAYNYQDLPFYRRTIANATFGYKWNSDIFKTHIVNPVQLNFVNLGKMDPSFEARIDSSSYLAYSYKDVLILGGNYSYIYSDQNIKTSKDYWFVRINVEAAGNLLLGLTSIFSKPEATSGNYQLFNQPFAQYIRADIDFRYNRILNDASSLVYRGFVGAGIPYGNSQAIPFEKQYFGGGANGIRAWQVRTLGPGSFQPDTRHFLNQTADIKIEANAEYRFKLFWILEGALFLDAGNIWSYGPTSPGSQFKLNKFINDLAVGTGTGLRFDFNFVLLRADMGVKLRNPAIESGTKWILLNQPYLAEQPFRFKNDFTIVVAIGYPF